MICSLDGWGCGEADGTLARGPSFLEALPAKDPLAVEIAFRFPKWAWTWGASPGLFKRLFG